MLKKILVIAALLFVPASVTLGADAPFTFGLLLVGPYNDHGWSLLVYRKSEQALMSGDVRPQTAVTTEDCGTQNFTCPVRARHLEPSNQNPIDSSNSMDSTNPTDSSNSMDPIDSRDFFVELPYTLVQDFTLFILMREKGIDIWKSKLDWVESKA